MRNFRTATLAVATATAMTLGGAATAVAEPNTNEASSSQQGGSSNSQQGDSSNKADDNNIYWVVDSFGKEKDKDNVPAWANSWNVGTIVASVGALIGLIIAGFNFASYNGWINL